MGRPAERIGMVVLALGGLAIALTAAVLVSHPQLVWPTKADHPLSSPPEANADATGRPHLSRRNDDHRVSPETRGVTGTPAVPCSNGFLYTPVR